MCGRFNVTSDPLNQLIIEITGRGFVVDNRLNLAPTEQVPVLRLDQAGEWELKDMRWWLLPWWSDAPSTKYSMFNAKSETLRTSRAFSEPFQRRRCVLPVTGYYEWRTQNKVKVPFYITPLDHSGFAMAGLWDRWRRDDTVIESCTIITAAAPPSMTGIHHRIPVHLTRQETDAWMNPDAGEAELTALLAPVIRMPLAVTPVSTYVNNARNKDERCIEPLGEISVIQP